MFNQTHIDTVSRATLGRLPRDGAERVWAFPSARCHLELKLKLKLTENLSLFGMVKNKEKKMKKKDDIRRKKNQLMFCFHKYSPKAVLPKSSLSAGLAPFCISTLTAS